MTQLREVRVNFEAKILYLNKEISNLQKQCTQKDKTIKDLSNEIKYINESSAKAIQECADNRESCITLTHALQRFEEDKKTYLIQEASRKQELIQVKISEQKNHDEIERLRQLLQEMEALQSTLVSHEVVDDIKDRLAKVQTDWKILDTDHKLLIERYSTIKSAIEHTFDKLNPSPSSKDSPSHSAHTGSDAKELINKVKSLLPFRTLFLFFTFERPNLELCRCRLRNLLARETRLV